MSEDSYDAAVLAAGAAVQAVEEVLDGEAGLHHLHAVGFEPLAQRARLRAFFFARFGRRNNPGIISDIASQSLQELLGSLSNSWAEERQKLLVTADKSDLCFRVLGRRRHETRSTVQNLSNLSSSFDTHRATTANYYCLRALQALLKGRVYFLEGLAIGSLCKQRAWCSESSCYYKRGVLDVLLLA